MARRPAFPERITPTPFSSTPAEQLRMAARHNEVARLRELLPAVPPDVADRYRTTALHAAAAQGALEAIQLLLEHGATVDSRDSKLRTPLHYAVANTQVAATRLLLTHGASPAALDSWGNSPLHTCLFGGRANLEVLQALLDAGADPAQNGLFGFVEERGFTEACALMRPYLPPAP